MSTPSQVLATAMYLNYHTPAVRLLTLCSPWAQPFPSSPQLALTHSFQLSYHILAMPVPVDVTRSLLRICARDSSVGARSRVRVRVHVRVCDCVRHFASSIRL